MRRGGFLDLTVTFEGIGQSKITKSMMNINLLNNWQLFASQNKYYEIFINFKFIYSVGA